MNRIRSMTHFQQGMLIFLMVMILVFSIAYPVTFSRVGFSYRDTIFVPQDETDSTVYTAKLNRKPASFTVDADKTVVFQYNGEAYGPYTAVDAPDAIPADRYQGSSMKGVELRCGDELIFRGGVLVINDSYWLLDSGDTNFHVSYFDSDGTERDENGNVIDPMEPDAASILQLISGPLLVHKGTWSAFILAVFVCIGNALTILFAEELFRWSMAFRIQNAEKAEPSEWEMERRYLSWIVLAGLALILFISGLK